MDMRKLKEYLKKLDNDEVLFFSSKKDALVVAGYAHISGNCGPYKLTTCELLGTTLCNRYVRAEQIRSELANDFNQDLLDEYVSIMNTKDMFSK